MSNVKFIRELAIGLPLLSCVFNKAKSALSTAELVNLLTSDSGYLCNFLIFTFASKYFTIGLVTCSDQWQRTGGHKIHMMPGLLVFSSLQCK